MISASTLYDPARQSPTLQQKTDYAAWDAANPRPWQQVTDPARRTAYEQWLKSPMQEDFEPWYWQQQQPAADQAVYNAGREAWQADRDKMYAATPGMGVMGAAKPAAMPPANTTGQPADAVAGTPAGSLFAPPTTAGAGGVVGQAGNSIMGRGGSDEETRRQRDRRFIG